MKITSTLLTFLILSFSTYAISPGKTAPSFELKNEKGKIIKLENLKGQYVILEWFNHGCPFVRKHYDSNNMQMTQSKAIKTLGDKKVTWLSINSSAKNKQGHLANPNEASVKLKEEKSNATHMLLDSDGKVGQAYGAKTTPQMVIIGPSGIVLYNGAIDSIASANQNDIKAAKNYILNAVKSIKNGEKVSPSKTKPYGCSVKY